MGYSTKCDWLFIASECLGNSSLPVGDYTWLTENLNGYRIALLGGDWYCGGSAGPFSWLLAYGVGRRYRNVGGRLVYVPTKNYFDLDRVFGNIIYNGDYKKYSLNLPPGNYNWSLQENTFYGSGKYALFTDDLRFEGGSVVSGKIYRWIGHSTQESYCFTSGTFTITDEMYIAVYNGNVDAVKSLLKTLRIEKA